MGGQDRPRDALQQRRVAVAVGLIGRELEARARALRQTEQTTLQRFSQLAEPHLQGRRRSAESTNDIAAAIGQTDPVVEGQVRVATNKGGRGIHE